MLNFANIFFHKTHQDIKDILEQRYFTISDMNECFCHLSSSFDAQHPSRSQQSHLRPPQRKKNSLLSDFSNSCNNFYVQKCSEFHNLPVPIELLSNTCCREISPLVSPSISSSASLQENSVDKGKTCNFESKELIKNNLRTESQLSISPDDFYMLNYEEISSMLDDIALMYKNFIRVLKEQQSNMNDESSILGEMRSLYFSHQTENFIKDKDVKRHTESDIADSINDIKNMETITDDILSFYGSYLKKNEEKENLYDDENFDCYIFHHSKHDDLPLGKILSVEKDNEEGYYKAFYIPFEELHEKKMNHEETDLQNKNSFKLMCLRKLERKQWWNSFIAVVQFIILFVSTMAVLALGAACYAQIEDPWHVRNNKTEIALGNKIDFQDGMHLIQKYNCTVKEANNEITFLDEVVNFVDIRREKLKNAAYENRLQDRNFILKKWIYFMVVSSTTIGYGDVTPKTNNGKIFYMTFSMISIPLMVVLLKSTGAVINVLQTTFFKLINKRLCSKKKIVSEELLSTITAFCLFVTYLMIGCVVLTALNELNFLDSAYLCLVTFTTVGFGDILPSLEVVLDNLIFFILYQIFGLALLASLIDSLISYLSYRKDEIIRKNKAKLVARFQKLQNISNST